MNHNKTTLLPCFETKIFVQAFLCWNGLCFLLLWCSLLLLVSVDTSITVCLSIDRSSMCRSFDKKHDKLVGIVPTMNFQYLVPSLRLQLPILRQLLCIQRTKPGTLWLQWLPSLRLIGPINPTATGESCLAVPSTPMVTSWKLVLALLVPSPEYYHSTYVCNMCMRVSYMDM